mgnify:CR=1 FL=1
MGSTYERSFIKGIVWEALSFIITTYAVFIVYGDFIASIKFSLILTIIKAFIFFFHERLWKKVKWGKVQDQKIKRK